MLLSQSHCFFLSISLGVSLKFLNNAHQLKALKGRYDGSLLFSSGAAALKLIYHRRNDKVSGESPNTYIYTRTVFFFSMVQFLESVVTVQNGSFADLETFILKISARGIS